MACSISVTYSPQIFGGGVDVGLVPPSASPPSFDDTGEVVFTYPYVSPTTTLTIRSPEMNDSKMVNVGRKVERSRNNTLLLVAATEWPTYTRLKYTFTVLSEAESEAWKDFVVESLGKEIGILDYEGQQWRGFILNPENTVTQERRGCGYTIQVDLEVE